MKKEFSRNINQQEVSMAMAIVSSQTMNEDMFTLELKTHHAYV